MHAALPTVLLTTALVLAPAAPASADFAAAQPTCAQDVAATADGTVYGAGDCGGSAVVLVRSPGGAWRSTGAGWRGRHVEAVAADEIATFVVLSCTQEDPACASADPLGKNFLIGKVPHGGGASALTPLGDSESTGDTATVAARGGRWWAAWSATTRDRDNPGSGSQGVFWRKTFGGSGGGFLRVPADPSGARTFVGEPSLALTASGAALAVVSTADREGAAPVLQLATAAADGRFSAAPYEPAAGAPADSPDVAYSGGRLFVAWSRERRPALAFERNGQTTRLDLPYRGEIAYGGVSVAASGGTVTVTTAERFAYRGGTTSRVYARALDAAGVLRSTTELTAGAGRRNPHLVGSVSGSTAARGKATVAFFDGTRRVTSTQR